MSNIILYHSSSHITKHPEYGLGKSYNDYGKGFNQHSARTCRYTGMQT